MGSVGNKYRVHEVAKDFGVPTKQITEILTKYAETPKNHMQVLGDRELSLIFESLTQHNQVSGIQAIYADAAKPAEKKAEPARQQPAARKAEAETIRRRPKARHYHRRMCRWTGADEAEYRLVLANLLVTCGHDLDCLRRKIMRQDEAILAFRRKYGVNADRRGPDG